MMKTFVLTGMAAALVAWSGVVQVSAQSKPAYHAPATQADKALSVPMGAREFARTAAMDGMVEVQLAKLAQQKATNADVKQFAKQMETDHTKANEELEMLAKTQGIILPTMIDAKHKATYDRLEKLSGPAFDSGYVQAMVTAHRAAVDLFRRESRMGKDPELKAWAAKVLPTLEGHLTMVQELNGTVGTSGTSAPHKPGSNR